MPGRSARGPETASTGRSARHFTSTPSERAGLRHVQARGTSSVTTPEGLEGRSPSGRSAFREVTFFSFPWVFCVNDCGRRLWG